MSHDLTDDSTDHEAERMIFEMDQKHAQALRMKRYRFRKKAGLVPPSARKLTPAQKRARNRKHAQAYRNRQPKKPKPDRRASYVAWRDKRDAEVAAERARREAQEDVSGE